jgi:hypothetical protein
MNWARLVEGRTKQAIERPVGFAAATVILGLIAGMQFEKLLSTEPLHFYDYIFMFVLGLLPLWHAAVLATAIRQLREHTRSANLAACTVGPTLTSQ